MNKTWIILKTEFINTITRRSFLLALILVPLIPAIILGAIALFGGGEADSGNIFQPSQPADVSDGYIDHADIITVLPDWLSENRLVKYESEGAAQQDALAGLIQGYYIIPADFIESGAIQYVRGDFNPLNAFEFSSVLDQVIHFNLLGADYERFETLTNPIQVQQVDLAPDDVERDQDSMLAFYLPYGVTMLFYALILSSATMMLNSIAKEKENRVMEILMSSVPPRQLLTGKILALGLVGLLQLFVWMGSALLLLRLGGTTLNIPPSLQLPPTLLLWGALYFILGYLIYASIMAGVGALVPNLKEASQATFIIIIPILIPLTLVGAIINAPHATLPVILSLIPFTAPNTMITRLAVTTVPVWQLLISIALMALTIILLIRAVAGMFRAQMLLTGQKFSLGLFLKVLMGGSPEAAEENS